MPAGDSLLVCGRPDLIVICGPTASGKTEAAIQVCQSLGGEVVSADAVQIYRHLDIGSAKPTPAERATVPHHLLDVVEPTERYSAARYAADADVAISGIRERGKLPVVAGGCGLYIKALLFGLCEAPPADAALRAELDEEARRHGRTRLHLRLAEVDPVAARRLHPADQVRIVRALEVYLLTGRPLSEHQAEHGFRAPRYNALVWGIDPGREVLHERINARVEQMVAEGFLREVARLLEWLPPGCPGLSSPGYRELVAHLRGELSLPEAVARIQRSHRRYARRQRTWFRKMPGLTWYTTAAELPMASFD